VTRRVSCGTTVSHHEVFQKRKTLPRGRSAGPRREVDGRAKREPWWAIEDCEIIRSVFRTDLHCLHASLGFGPGLEHAVVDDRRCGRRLFIDDGAFLGGCVPHHIVFAGDCGLRKG
jgi:hypothetical protein